MMNDSANNLDKFITVYSAANRSVFLNKSKTKNDVTKSGLKMEANISNENIDLE